MVNTNQGQAIGTLILNHHSEDQQQLTIGIHRSQLIPNNRQGNKQLNRIKMIINTKLSHLNNILNLYVGILVDTATLGC
jgi:hypothetical protein